MPNMRHDNDINEQKIMEQNIKHLLQKQVRFRSDFIQQCNIEQEKSFLGRLASTFVC